MSMIRRRNHGFTLIELIIFIVVISAGLAGILSVMNTVVKSSADPLVRKQSIAIAESLLEEILLKEYANPAGGDTGALRASFDDVDQYAGYNTADGITDPLGDKVASLSNYNVSPSVAVGTTTIGTLAVRLTVKQVTVSVTGPQGVVRLTGYRGNY